MTKILSIILFLLITSTVIGQVIGRVDKKTKQFTVDPNQKVDYQVFGYWLTSKATQKMICFSSHEGNVRANYSQCPLGSYFDTDKLHYGDKIYYIGPAGGFAKMNFVAAGGKKTIFYLPKSCFVIK